MWIARDGTQNAMHRCVYDTGTLVYSTARAGISCIKKEEPIKNSSVIRWTFFQFRSTSSRKDDLMDIDMVKSRETRNTIRLTRWRKDARKSISEETMIDWYEIQNSVFEWLKIIETKTFVDDGMLLRMKIILTIRPHKNTSTMKANGGFIPISKVPILCRWSIDLISSRHCLSCNNWNKKQKKPPTLTEINNGHRVLLLLHGGIGKVHGGLFVIPRDRTEMHQVLTERGWPVECSIWRKKKSFWTILSWIQLLCYRWIVYSWRRSTVTDGWCKHNTSNDMFSRCRNVQEMATGKELTITTYSLTTSTKVD